MSIFFNYCKFNSKQIQLKKPTVQFINSEQIIYVPLRHKKREIYIKTPKIVAPFGLNIYTSETGQKSYYYVLSFTDTDIDPHIDQFLIFLRKVEDFCCDVTRNNISLWSDKYTFDNLNFKSSFKEKEGAPLFRLKIVPNMTEIYDEKGTLQSNDHIEELITEHCQIMSLLELGNIWINSSEFGISWKVRQMKIYPSTRLLGGISMLTETVKTHDDSPFLLSQPPPPPPPPIHKVMGFNPLCGCFALINTGNFTLKKAEIQNRPQFKSDLPEISLDEILKIRRNLRANNQQQDKNSS
jgi:hypothetical protein